MNSISFILLAVFVIWVLSASRRWALVGMVAGLLFLTQGHSLNLGGANFFPSRILCYACALRVISRREFSVSLFTKVDWLLVALYGFVTLILLVRPGESVPLTIAKLLDILLAFFVFRGLIATPEEFRWFLRALVFMLVPYVMLLAVESFTHNNAFSIVGGNRSDWLRDGKLRCFGSFRHPSILGSLGACFLPLFIATAWERENRRWSVLGILLCSAIVGFSNSGGPLSAFMVALIGWLLWPMRRQMRWFRRSLAVALILLGLAMKAPIWYLPSRVSAITGGSGWHRSYLMDVAFRHFGEWWAIGMPIKETKGWFPYTLATTGGADITNQYIGFGLNAGILAIALFILFIVLLYSRVGRALETLREFRPDEPDEERLLWGFGVVLSVHVANWLGISYFDQFNMIWLLQAAVLCSLSEFWIENVPPEAGDPASQCEEAIP